VNEVSLTDERLAWLAVRDDLNKQLRGSFGLALLGFFADGGFRRGVRSCGSSRGGMISGRMAVYAEAVDDLAGELSAEERRTLRTTRQVPAWFLPRVQERAKELRKRH
jgi:hypothetical protein